MRYYLCEAECVGQGERCFVPRRAELVPRRDAPGARAAARDWHDSGRPADRGVGRRGRVLPGQLPRPEGGPGTAGRAGADDVLGAWHPDRPHGHRDRVRAKRVPDEAAQGARRPEGVHDRGRAPRPARPLRRRVPRSSTLGARPDRGRARRRGAARRPRTRPHRSPDLHVRPAVRPPFRLAAGSAAVVAIENEPDTSPGDPS